MDSTRGLAREKDFYKWGEIKETDLIILEELIKPCDESLKKLHREFFINMWKLQLLAKQIKDRKNRVQWKERLSSNVFEDYLSLVELRGKYFVDRLVNGEHVDFSLEENAYNFIYFLGYQFSRTKKIKEISLCPKGWIIDTNNKFLLQDFVNRNWWFMCSFFGTNIAKNLALDSKLNIRVIKNRSDTKFITSDQPVININKDGSNGEELDLYYPLSPTKALIAGTSNTKYSDKDEVNCQQANDLNIKLSSQALSMLYGEDKEDIEKYKEYITRKNSDKRDL